MAKGPTISVKITGDTKGLSKATGQAEKDVEGFGKKVSGFAVGAGAAVTTFGLQAIPALVGFGSELYALGQASEVGAKKTEKVFGDSASDVSAWADEVNESLGLSDEAVGTLATSMGDLLVPMGFSREEAARLSMDTTEAAGALSAWSEGQYDASEVSAILTKAMLGEREGLKALGISISAAEVDERALTIAKKEGRKEITAQDKAIATQQLIMEKSTDAQTAWTDGTMDSVKAQNELTAKVADAKEGLAKGLLPIVQKVMSFLVTHAIPAVEKLVATFQKKWPQIKATIQPIMKWIEQTVRDVLAVAAALWERFGDRIMTYVRISFDYARDAIRNVMKVIQGVIDVVLGVITGDWSRAWKGVLAILSGVWAQIKNVVRTGLKLVGLLLDIAWENIKGVVRSAWNGIKSLISAAINGIVGYVRALPGRIGHTLRTTFDGLKTGITIAKNWIRSRINDIIGFVAGIPGRVAGAVSSAFSAIPRAFKSAINGIIGAWNRLSFRIKGGPWDPLGRFGPSIPAVNFGFNTPNIPYLAEGGIVKARPGGMLAVIGEGKYDEAVVPLKSGAGRAALGGGTTIIQNFPASVRPSDVIRAQRDWSRRNGPVPSFGRT